MGSEVYKRWTAWTPKHVELDARYCALTYHFAPMSRTYVHSMMRGISCGKACVHGKGVLVATCFIPEVWPIS